jgi:hypothetical protein
MSVRQRATFPLIFPLFLLYILHLLLSQFLVLLIHHVFLPLVYSLSVSFFFIFFYVLFFISCPVFSFSYFPLPSPPPSAYSIKSTSLPCCFLMSLTDAAGESRLGVRTSSNRRHSYINSASCSCRHRVHTGTRAQTGASQLDAGGYFPDA